MSTSRTPLSNPKRPAWSTRCSTRSRGNSAPTSSHVARATPASGEDSLIARYFRPIPPDPIARKALRVNLSDLAAKGAPPAGFVLTLALRSADEAWLKPFAAALGEDAASFDCPLLGGDTVSTP